MCQYSEIPLLHSLTKWKHLDVSIPVAGVCGYVLHMPYRILILTRPTPPPLPTFATARIVESGGCIFWLSVNIKLL